MIISNVFSSSTQNLVKGMEGFITGDRGPESFYQAQDQVWKVLERDHYPSFLVVLTCQMTGRRQQLNGSEPDSATKERHLSWREPWIADSADSEESGGGVLEWSEQTQLAKSRIEYLDGRLAIKLQAVTSLRNIAPADSSSLVTSLEKEVECLQTERREVEGWLNQAESWTAHLGQWKASVSTPQVCSISE